MTDNPKNIKKLYGISFSPNKPTGEKFRRVWVYTEEQWIELYEACKDLPTVMRKQIAHAYYTSYTTIRKYGCERAGLAKKSNEMHNGPILPSRQIRSDLEYSTGRVYKPLNAKNNKRRDVNVIPEMPSITDTLNIPGTNDNTGTLEYHLAALAKCSAKISQENAVISQHMAAIAALSNK